MKNLIVFLVLLVPFSLLAQITQTVDKNNNDKTIEYMNKIATDSELRSQMMTMIMDNIKGNNVEMTRLIRTISADPEMHKIMMAALSEENGSQINSVKPREMKINITKPGEMNKTESVLKKQ